MAWIATDEDGSVHLFIDKPGRIDGLKDWYPETDRFAKLARPEDVEYLLGRKLNWDDDPIEV